MSRRTKWGVKETTHTRGIKNKTKKGSRHYDSNNSNVIIPDRISLSPEPQFFLCNSQATRAKLVKTMKVEKLNEICWCVLLCV